MEGNATDSSFPKGNIKEAVMAGIDKLSPKRIEVWWDTKWKSRTLNIEGNGYGDAVEHDSYGLAIEWAARKHPGFSIVAVISDPVND